MYITYLYMGYKFKNSFAYTGGNIHMRFRYKLLALGVALITAITGCGNQNDNIEVETELSDEQLDYMKAEAEAAQAKYFDISTLLNDKETLNEYKDTYVSVGGQVSYVNNSEMGLVDNINTAPVDQVTMKVEVGDPMTFGGDSLKEFFSEGQEVVVTGRLSLDEHSNLVLNCKDYLDALSFTDVEWSSIPYGGDIEKSTEYFSDANFNDRSYWLNFEGNSLTDIISLINNDMLESDKPLWVRSYNGSSDELVAAQHYLAEVK